MGVSFRGNVWQWKSLANLVNRPYSLNLNQPNFSLYLVSLYSYGQTLSIRQTFLHQLTTFNLAI